MLLEGKYSQLHNSIELKEKYFSQSNRLKVKYSQLNLLEGTYSQSNNKFVTHINIILKGVVKLKISEIFTPKILCFA